MIRIAMLPQAEAAGCAHDLLARVTLRDDGGFLSIPAAIDGQQVRLMIDTGSDAGLITPQAVARLGIASAPAPGLQIIGTGGQGQVAGIARVRTLTIGTARLERLAIPIGTLPGAPMLVPPIVGFLGGDVLSHFDLDIDLPHATLSLWRIQALSLACAPAPLWPAPFSTIALSRHGVRLQLTALLDGSRISALLDTGARSMLVSPSAANRAGISQGTLEREPGGVSRGVDMREQTYHWHRFASLRIGDETIMRPELTVAPLSEPFDMLLGTDWMQRREIWISYTGREVFVKRDAVAN